ncbi:energy transducer TonB [Bryobacter aggregatus]|uniref:energy transducer TonB n=1 Tax=Bryobacter aggregatus TaxID=360054 RepID=UPI0004E1E147|nr:hypothetical protein [Bryobacter aggregatus]
MKQENLHQEVRDLLHTLPRRRLPDDLRMQLKISASKEASRRKKWASAPAFVVRMKNHFELWKANMMRPFAVPCAGGLAAALLVFTMFVQTYPVRANTLTGDRPTALYTEPAAKTLAPFEPPTADAEIEVSIDDQGRIADYRVVAGNPEMDIEVRLSVERTLLFTQFIPATSFGQAVPSKLRISLRRGASAITVKG